MAKLTDSRRQHLKVNETQMEMHTDSAVGSSPLSEDFEGKLVAAQQQLEQLQQQQELIERQKAELQELNERKEEFLEGQISINERLAAALTAIDRSLFDMRQEMEDLEQTRKCFSEHQQKIDAISPEGWTRDELKHELSRAISMLDHAEDEYEEAMNYFSSGSHSSIFGGAKAKPNKVAKANTATSGEFATMFKQGLAFNLPIFILGTIALLIYLSK